MAVSYTHLDVYKRQELQRMNNLADEQVNVIKAALGIHGSIAVKKDEDNLDAVLVLYAVTHGQTENFPYGIKITNQQDRDELQSIYWCMTQTVSYTHLDVYKRQSI